MQSYKAKIKPKYGPAIPIGENYATLAVDPTCVCFELTFLMTEIDEHREIKDRLWIMSRRNTAQPVLETKQTQRCALIITLTLSKRYVDDRFEFLYSLSRVSDFIFDERSRGGENGLYTIDVRTRQGTTIPIPLDIKVPPPDQHANFLDSHIEIDIEKKLHLDQALRQAKRLTRLREYRYLPTL